MGFVVPPKTKQNTTVLFHFLPSLFLKGKGLLGCCGGCIGMSIGCVVVVVSLKLWNFIGFSNGCVECCGSSFGCSVGLHPRTPLWLFFTCHSVIAMVGRRTGKG